MLKVGLSMCQDLVIKEKVGKVRSLYVKCLKASVDMKSYIELGWVVYILSRSF